MALQMSPQLGAVREGSPAALEVTFMRLLSCMRAHVSLYMVAAEKGFPAPGEGAHEGSLHKLRVSGGKNIHKGAVTQVCGACGASVDSTSPVWLRRWVSSRDCLEKCF
jgi:hypothetical protein